MLCCDIRYYVIFTTLLISFVLCDITCNSVPSTPGDRRTNQDELNVITYNAEWLFLANEEDPSSCPSAGCPYPTLLDALEHVMAVANELKTINADIINLVEVEGCEVLQTLVDYIGSDYGYEYYLIEGDDTYTGQNVAVLTKVDPVQPLQRTDSRAEYPVSNTTCTGYIEQDDYGVSKNYFAKYNVTGTVINMFAVHFLAYPDDMDRCYKREAQATVMAEYMKEEVKLGEHVIVLGDMNDFDSTLVDINDDQPISNVLEILSTPFASFRFGGNPLLNVGTTVDIQDERFTSWYDRNDDCDFTKNELSAIDHMLIDHYLATNFLSVAKYVHNYLPTCTTAISDHYPILSTFAIPDNKEE